MGLFGFIGTEGIVKNLGIKDGSVTGGDNVGALAGVNGNNGEEIDGSTVTNVYATADVSGQAAVDGLVGRNFNGVIEDAHAKGAVDVDGNSNNVGGLVGKNESGSIVASYWDTKTTGQDTSAGGTGLPTDDMKDPFTFIDAGWDFDDVWGQSRTNNNSGYMVLKVLDDTAYDYYVRLDNTDTDKTFGDSNPDLSVISLDGPGSGKVTLQWGDAITRITDVGTYAYDQSNVLDPRYDVGRRDDYYINYGSGSLTAEPPVTRSRETQYLTYFIYRSVCQRPGTRFRHGPDPTGCRSYSAVD